MTQDAAPPAGINPARLYRRLTALDDRSLDQLYRQVVCLLSGTPGDQLPLLENFCPRTASRVLVLGKAGSGKTSLIREMLGVDSEGEMARLFPSDGGLGATTIRALLRRIDVLLPQADAVSVGDYGKGVVTQPLLDALKERCRAQGKWLSLDPKPVHQLDLRGLSLLTPNRKEAFELAGLGDTTRNADPSADAQLMKVAERLLADLSPALLLITLGELGMLLCRRGAAPYHIPTVAQEVFDVAGAGDTVIASFTLAIAAGASPVEAAIFSNHAAGVVVGKVGTATVTPEELVASFGGAR